ncbi:MAG TPA: hypothetical protein VGL72_19935 [Bryobacteraceae bacterium]|jgi:hypothetical protein
MKKKADLFLEHSLNPKELHPLILANRDDWHSFKLTDIHALTRIATIDSGDPKKKLSLGVDENGDVFLAPGE